MESTYDQVYIAMYLIFSELSRLGYPLQITSKCWKRASWDVVLHSVGDTIAKDISRSLSHRSTISLDRLVPLSTTMGYNNWQHQYGGGKGKGKHQNWSGYKGWTPRNYQSQPYHYPPQQQQVPVGGSFSQQFASLGQRAGNLMQELSEVGQVCNVAQAYVAQQHAGQLASGFGTQAAAHQFPGQGLGGVQALSSAVASGTLSERAMAQNLLGRQSEVVHSTADASINDAIAKHPKFLEMQEKVSALDSKVDSTNKAVESIQGMQNDTVRILEGLGTRLDTMNAQQQEHAKLAREEARLLAGLKSNSSSRGLGLASATVAGKTAAGGPGSTDIDLQSFPTLAHLESQKYRAFLLTLMNVSFDTELHKSFTEFIKIDPEDANIDFSSIARKSTWSWGEYWAVLQPIKSFSHWKRKASAKFLRLPEQLVTSMSTSDEIGILLLATFISYARFTGENYTATVVPREEDLSAVQFDKLMPQSVWQD